MENVNQCIYSESKKTVYFFDDTMPKTLRKNNLKDINAVLFGGIPILFESCNVFSETVSI